MEVIYDMKKESPFISKLYPKDRVSGIKEDELGDFYREAIDEPIYFNLKPNSDFKEVQILVKYKFTGDSSLRLGGFVDKKNWAFDFFDMPKTKEDEWGTIMVKFDLSKLARERENYRFMFSAPGLASGKLAISEIKVDFWREPMTFKEAMIKIWEGIKWRMKGVRF